MRLQYPSALEHHGRTENMSASVTCSLDFVLTVQMLPFFNFMLFSSVPRLAALFYVTLCVGSQSHFRSPMTHYIGLIAYISQDSLLT